MTCSAHRPRSAGLRSAKSSILIGLIALMILVLAGCGGLLLPEVPAPPDRADGGEETGALRVTIAGMPQGGTLQAQRRLQSGEGGQPAAAGRTAGPVQAGPAQAGPVQAGTVQAGTVRAATLLPAPSAVAFTSYRVRLAGPGSTIVDQEFTAGSELILEDLEPDSWTVTVDGMANGVSLARGTADVAVVGGETRTASLALAPLRDGDGTLQLSVTWPEGHVSDLTASLEDEDGNTTEIGGDFTLTGAAGARTGASYEAGVSAGYHLLRIVLRSEGTVVATIMESVLVLKTRTTSGDLEVKPAELGAPPTPPTALQVTMNPDQIGNDLSWSDSSNVTDTFEIQRRTDPSADWVEIARLDGSVSVDQDYQLSNYESAEYRIRAVNRFGPTEPELGWVSFPSFPDLRSEYDTGVADDDDITNKLNQAAVFTGAMDADAVPQDAVIQLRANADAGTSFLLSQEETLSATGFWNIGMNFTVEGSFTLRVEARGTDGRLLAAAEGTKITIDATGPTTAPRLLRPRNGFNSGADRRPTFTWTSDTQYAGGVELQAADNPSFTNPAYHWTELSGESFEPDNNMSVAAAPPVGTRYYLRMRGVDEVGNPGVWSTDVPGAAPQRYVNVGRFDGDFDGDGDADVLVGAYRQADSSGNRFGAVHLFEGGTTADSSVDLQIAGEQDGDGDGRFGLDVAYAGDVNADGYADMIVGAPYYGNDDAGRVYLFYGGSGTTDMGAATADLIIDNPDTPSHFGASLAGVGDIDADGYDDFMVGAFDTSDNPIQDLNPSQGTPPEPDYVFAYLYTGGDPVDAQAEVELDWPVTDFEGLYNQNPVPADSPYTVSVAGAGDVNGDGFGDYFISAPTYFLPDFQFPGSIIPFVGQVTLYFGGNPLTQPDQTEPADFAVVGEGDDLVGAAISSAGDFDGDGYDDILVGSAANRAMLYYGSPDFGTASGNGPPESSAIPRPSGPSSWTTGTNFAVTAAGLGNFTGDAYDDIVIGDFRESSTQHDGGRAAVYYGRSDRPAEITSYDRHVRGLQADERAGRTLGTPGDVDADGLNDLLLGAPRHDIGGDSERGTVRLYPGTDGALSLADSYEGSAVTAGGSTYAAGEERFGFGLGRGW